MKKARNAQILLGLPYNLLKVVSLGDQSMLLGMEGGVFKH